jgi:hypothetical protein
MDTVALYVRMAERWQIASCEATSATLRACYARRAQRYLELAASQSNRQVRSETPAESA